MGVRWEGFCSACMEYVDEGSKSKMTVLYVESHEAAELQWDLDVLCNENNDNHNNNTGKYIIIMCETCTNPMSSPAEIRHWLPRLHA